MNDFYKKALERNLKAEYFISFFQGLIFTIPIWVAFELRLLNYSQMALLTIFEFIVTTILEVPSGAFADLVGRKKSIMIGVLIVALSNVFIGVNLSLTSLILCTFFIAAGNAFISGADSALLYDSLKELKREGEISKFSSRLLLIHRVGIILASFVGGFMYEKYIGLPYISRGLCFFLTFIVLFFVTEPIIDTIKFSIKGYFLQLKMGAKELSKNSHNIKLTIYYALIASVTWSCLYYFNNTFAKDVGYTEVGQGYLFSSIYIITATILLIITEKKGFLKKKSVYLAFPLILSTVFLPGVFANKLLALPILIGTVLCGGARFAILDSYVNEEFESRYRATALSTLNMIVSILFIVIVGLSGLIQDVYSTKVIFSILGVLTFLIALPSAVLLIKDSRYN